MSNAVQPVPHVPQLPTPAHVGQATAIEQSRAVAEVHAAIVVAQQCPRDVEAAINAMRYSCQKSRLAERAFYSYSKGGSAVTGATVHLARELARVWGNVQYGIAELRRDDEGGYSEMQAYAWDVQTNTRSAQIFVVPHKRDKRGGPERLGDLRDIYENNANQGARRLRAAIFSVLPPWFVEEAEDLCNATLKAGNGKPLTERIADAVSAYETAGVTVGQLEAKVGRKRAEWSDQDVAQLGVLYRSVDRGEITRDEAFPPPPVTVAEITQTSPKTAPKTAPKTPSEESHGFTYDPVADNGRCTCGQVEDDDIHGGRRAG